MWLMITFGALLAGAALSAYSTTGMDRLGEQPYGLITFAILGLVHWAAALASWEHSFDTFAGRLSAISALTVFTASLFFNWPVIMAAQVEPHSATMLNLMSVVAILFPFGLMLTSPARSAMEGRRDAGKWAGYLAMVPVVGIIVAIFLPLFSSWVELWEQWVPAGFPILAALPPMAALMAVATFFIICFPIGKRRRGAG